MKKSLLFAFFTMICLVTNANGVEIDGIYYTLDSKNKTAGVTYLYYKSWSNSGAYSDDITIPSKVTYNNVTYDVTYIGDYSFFHCNQMTSVTIPNSVTGIGMGAFESCSGLTSVIIGNNVKVISDFAFRYCSNLTSVTCMAEAVPKTKSTAFYDFPFEDATLYVPATSIENYKDSEPWSSFSKIEIVDNTDMLEVFFDVVKFKCQGSLLKVLGVQDNMPVCVYNANGVLIGSTLSHDSQATIIASLYPRSVALIKIGLKTYKVIVK